MSKQDEQTNNDVIVPAEHLHMQHCNNKTMLSLHIVTETTAMKPPTLSTHLWKSFTHLIHIGLEEKKLTSLIWNPSYQLKMFLLKLIPHFTQFTSNLNLHANSHVTFVVFFFCSPFVSLPFFDVLYAIRDRFEQRGEVCTKSSISYKIKTIFIFLYCMLLKSIYYNIL